MKTKDVQKDFLERVAKDNLEGASMKYSAKNKKLTVKKHGKTIYKEKLDIPDWMDVEVVGGKYLKVSDSKGTNFRVGFGDKSQGRHAFIGLNSYAWKDDEALFDMTVDDLTGGVGSVSNIINNLSEGVCNWETRAQESEIEIGDKSLRCWGPNRLGEYELSSGQSSVFYNPKTGELRPGYNWSHETELIDKDPSEGDFHLREGKDNWRLKLRFGNNDPEDSYIAHPAYLGKI